MPPSIAAAASCSEPMAVRALIVVLAALVALLQYRAWFGDVGYFAAQELAGEVDDQRRRGEELARRNEMLTAEVVALKTGIEALEARARKDLGMVKQGETFYLIPDDD
jgi:cell division protein FtsB